MGRARRKMGLWHDFKWGSNEQYTPEQMKPRVSPPGQRPLSDPRWLQTPRGKGALILVSHCGLTWTTPAPPIPSSTRFRNQKKPTEHKPALVRAVSQYQIWKERINCWGGRQQQGQPVSSRL